MSHDFETFLSVYRSRGPGTARESVETWKQNGLIDVTQYALMISYVERKSGNIEGSNAVLRRSLSEGGESAPLNVSLAENHLNRQEYVEAVRYCDNVIRDKNELIASRFLSSAFLLKSYALLKLGKPEIAETILSFLRPDLTRYIEGKLESPETLLARLREH
jgi:lipopolysaccharide biosynthesis regulator YciM